MKCKRCGKCCHRGDFWYLSNHPFIKAFDNVSKKREDGKCLMLSGNTCLIERYLGYQAKPDVCKEYDCEKE